MSTKRLNMRSVSYVIGVKTFDNINIRAAWAFACHANKVQV